MRLRRVRGSSRGRGPTSSILCLAGAVPAGVRGILLMTAGWNLWTLVSFGCWAGSLAVAIGLAPAAIWNWGLASVTAADAQTAQSWTAVSPAATRRRKGTVLPA